MPRILIGRHGESLANLANIISGIGNEPLSPKGLKQAYELAERLSVDKSLNIRLILSSRLERAFVTAAISAEELGCPHEIWEDLHERDHGCLEGKHYSQIESLATQCIWKDGYLYVIDAPNCETYPQLFGRAGATRRGVKQNLIERGFQGDALLLGHAAIGRALEGELKGVNPNDPEAVLAIPRIENCEYRFLEEF